MEEFEHLVMTRLLSTESTGASTLRAQYAAATVLRREFTGVGFFVDFSVPDTIQRTQPADREIHAAAECSGVEHGVGFVLFVRQGALATLEGFTYDEAWPERPRITAWLESPRRSDAQAV